MQLRGRTLCQLARGLCCTRHSPCNPLGFWCDRPVGDLPARHKPGLSWLGLISALCAVVVLTYVTGRYFRLSRYLFGAPATHSRIAGEVEMWTYDCARLIERVEPFIISAVGDPGERELPTGMQLDATAFNLVNLGLRKRRFATAFNRFRFTGAEHIYSTPCDLSWIPIGQSWDGPKFYEGVNFKSWRPAYVFDYYGRDQRPIRAQPIRPNARLAPLTDTLRANGDGRKSDVYVMSK